MLNQRGINGVGLNNMDILCLIIAGLAHDVGHDGFNNGYHNVVESKRCLKFLKLGGIQEGFHAATTILLLDQEQNDIFAQDLTSTARRLIKKRILISILDTDMATKKDLE